MSFSTRQVPCIKTLPYDVVELIVAELRANEDDWEVVESLASSRLISHTFNYLATPHVFKDIHLVRQRGGGYFYHGDPTRPEKRVQQLLSLIKTNPAIATFIRGCHIYTYAHNFEGRWSNWLAKPEALVELLPQLTRVTHLAIKGYDAPVMWRKLGQPLVEALENMIRMSSNIELVAVEGLSLVSVLERGPTEELPAPIDVNNPPLVASKAQLPPLTSLAICDTTLAASRILDDYPDPGENATFVAPIPIVINRLQLTIGYEKLQDTHLSLEEHFHILLSKMSANLMELDINFTSSTLQSRWPSRTSLTFLRRIESIKLHASVQGIGAHKCHFGLPKPFTHALQRLKPSTSMRTIHLVLRLQQPAQTSAMWTLRSQWGKLERVIARTYPQLTTLVVEFQEEEFVCPMGDDVVVTRSHERMREYLYDALSGIVVANRGLIVKVVIPTQPDFIIGMTGKGQ
ncbi:hypothetical protein CVT24_000263 [Panaeolus cyanescens]|uniref:F-box domain-containing protein n=1 Tax=Panaeolus cyanescens TaxID=181874 RepID=A0A409YD66_9AGAR|nr:hypothetical protein CVT24_000263 [Panaeolus cyanescens]